MTKKAAWPCDVVSVRRRRTKRTLYRCPGHGSTPKAACEARTSAREPWLLVHGARLRRYAPEQIVAFYAQRMQIEENFRDNKSLGHGMEQDIGRSRSVLRWQALLLIATLAAREISIVTLARLLCTLPKLPLTGFAVQVLYQRIGVRQ